MTARLRVGVFTVRQVVEADDGLVAEIGLGRVLTQLLNRYPDLRVAAVDAGTVTTRHNEPLTLTTQRWLRLPPMPSFKKGLAKTWICYRTMRQLEDQCDVVLAQVPFPAPLALLRPRRPRVYHLVADVREMAGSSGKYAGATRWVAMVYAWFVDAILRYVARKPNARLVANGEALLQHFGVDGRAAVSSSITRDDLTSVTRRRPASARFRVLFVANIRPEKGLDVLLTAMEKVRTTVDAELEVVGYGDPADLGDDVNRQFTRAAEEGWATHPGPRAFGPDLFQHFADADLFVLPSRSEGTPRVLVEARAFGCPAVATRVGGIPTSMRDGEDGLLVEPDDADGLADAILRLYHDEPLRRRLGENGRARAEAMTVESFTQVVIEELESLGSRRP